jgi:hypothetical protein
MLGRRRPRYNLYMLLIIFSTIILPTLLVVTSLKSLRTDRHFTDLILEENKTFLINTLRFSHDLMARTGTERYEDLINLALKIKFIYSLAILDNEGKLICPERTPCGICP